MSMSAGRPPKLHKGIISGVVLKYFNFSVVHEESIKNFPSYDDMNFYFQGKTPAGGGNEFVLKLTNPLHTSLSESKGIYEVMKHVQSCGIIPQCPQKSRAGPDIIQLSHKELLEGGCSGHDSSVPEGRAGADHINNTTARLDEPFCYVSILSYAEGEMFDHVEKKYLTPNLLHEIGEMLAKMNKEMVSDITLLWTVRKGAFLLLNFYILRALLLLLFSMCGRTYPEIVVQISFIEGGGGGGGGFRKYYLKLTSKL